MLKKLKKIQISLVMVLMFTASAFASSHREAPFITEMPKVDAADFYMFRDYDPGREGFVVLMANYLPLQAAYGGPNYFSLDPDALYEIHVDNNGDAIEDITFQFRFKNELQDTKLSIGGKQVAIPLINFGGISASDTSKLNMKESYGVKIVRGNRRGSNVGIIKNVANGSAIFAKPVDNIGNKSIPNYEAYAMSHLYGIAIPGCAIQGGMFVGQRKDPFVVNLGEAFDLINTNPLGPVNGEKDSLVEKNVTTIALHVPISCLTNGTEGVIGAWTTASLRQGRLLNPRPTFASPTLEGGAWTQVSRLGSPLVNELVIGLKDKDRFNASKPNNDSQFADYVTHPTFPALIEILYPSAPAPTLFPRTDLVAAFLTGVATVNQPANVVAAEMLRLNTAIAPTLIASQNNLGVIAGDNAGFPNGRRPGDDVVDIALRVVMGKLISLGLFGTPTQAPAGNAALTDGALVNAAMFDASFPFLKSPIPGSPN
jgi:hypothetical protein